MNTHLDYQLFLILGKGLLLSVVLLSLAGVLLRRRSANTSSLYWRMGMLGLLLLPVISVSLPWLPISPVDQPPRPTAAVAMEVAVAVPSVSKEWTAPTPVETILPAHPTESAVMTPTIPEDANPASEARAATFDWFGAAVLCGLCIWSVGFLFVVGRWLRARNGVKKLAHSPAARTLDWSASLETLGVQEGEVRIAISEEVSSPIVWGILKPTILLPLDAAEWSDAKKQQVLVHELCHVKRRDPLFLLLARIGVAIHWINPLVWVMARRLRLADERTADDAVLQIGSDPGQYASLLAGFARRSIAGAEAVAPSMASGSSVGVRVRRILDATQRRESPRRAMRCLFGLLTLAIVVVAGGLSIAPAVAQESLNPGKKKPAVPVDAKPAKTEVPAPLEVGEEETIVQTEEELGIEYLNHKLKHIIVPVVQFEDTTVAEAVEFLRMRSREGDEVEPDPARKGINIVIVGKEVHQRKVTSLKLMNVPLATVLKYVCELTNTEFKVSPFAVMISDAGAVPAEGANAVAKPAAGAEGRVIVTYKVPPDFLDRVSTNRAPDNDPFGGGGAVPRPRKSLIDVLKEVGIDFRAGESAQFIPARSELIVSARPEVHDLVAALVEEINDALPSMIKVRIELYEVPKAEALKIVKHDQDKSDGSGAYKMVETLVAGKSASLLAVPTALLRPGQQGRVQSGFEISYTSSYQPKDGKDTPVISKALVGSSVEIEPNVGADGQTLDVRCSLYMSRGEPKTTRRMVTAPISGRNVEVESVSLETFKLSQGCTMLTGQTLLLGTMRTSIDAKQDNEIVAFLTATISKVRR